MVLSILRKQVLLKQKNALYAYDGGKNNYA